MLDGNTFKHDYDFVMPAVQENGFAFVLAGNAFKRDHDFETAALELILLPGRHGVVHHGRLAVAARDADSEARIFRDPEFREPAALGIIIVRLSGGEAPHGHHGGHVAEGAQG